MGGLSQGLKAIEEVGIVTAGVDLSSYVLEQVDALDQALL